MQDISPILVPNLFADIEGKGLYPVAPLLFVSDIELVLPPAGWRPSVSFATRWSFDGDMKSTDLWWWPRGPYELLGLDGRLLARIRETDGLTVHVWDPSEDSALGNQSESQIRRKLLCGDIQRYGRPSDNWLRSLLGAYIWVWSDIRARRGKYRVAEVSDTGSAHTDTCDLSVRQILAHEAVSLAVPSGIRLPLSEMIDIRREIAPLLAPFWRTIRRLEGTLVTALPPKGEIDFQQLLEVVRVVVDAELGTTLAAWSEELSTDLARCAPEAVSKWKRWGKILLTIVAGAVKRDIEQLAGIIFEVPSSSQAPSDMPKKDYDQTVKLLSNLRRDLASEIAKAIASDRAESDK